MKKYNYGKQDVSLADVFAVIKALKSDFLTQGDEVTKFEKAICDYTGAKYAVAVSNATAGLHIATLATGIKSKEEFITSPNTFVASANCGLYANANVIFADIEKQTANISVEEIKKKITNKTKLIIPVHFGGQSCDMKEIKKIADVHDLFVIEDAAHAIGTDYNGKKTGSCEFSDMAVFSFHPVKTITTGEGGVITTNNDDLYQKLIMLRSHGITKDEKLLSENQGSWYYQMQSLGFNYRLTDIQCALGTSQLKRLDLFKKRRKEIVEFYKKAFINDDRVSFLQEKEYNDPCYHLCPALFDFDKIGVEKKEFFDKLKTFGLNLQVHYIPVHTQPYYKNLGFKEEDCPNAVEYYKKTISLPLYPKLKNNDLAEIARRIKKAMNDS